MLNKHGCWRYAFRSLLQRCRASALQDHRNSAAEHLSLDSHAAAVAGRQQLLGLLGTEIHSLDALLQIWPTASSKAARGNVQLMSRSLACHEQQHLLESEPFRVLTLKLYSQSGALMRKPTRAVLP